MKFLSRLRLGGRKFLTWLSRAYSNYALGLIAGYNYGIAFKMWLDGHFVICGLLVLGSLSIGFIARRRELEAEAALSQLEAAVDGAKLALTKAEASVDEAKSTLKEESDVEMQRMRQ